MSSQNPVIASMKRFQTVRNPIVRAIVDFYIIPVIAGIMIIFNVFFYKAELGIDWMWITAWLAVAAAAILFREISHRVPETLEALWCRELLILPCPRDATEDTDLPGQEYLDYLKVIMKQFFKILPHRSDMPMDLAERYRLYIVDFENWLNNWGWNIVSGFLIGLVVVFMFKDIPSWDTLVFLSFAIMYSVAFILGMFLWRMLIIAYQIRILGNNFDFDLQIKHPDGCGGLNVLGDLNLINTAIITIPGIFFAVWIILLKQAESNLMSLAANVTSNLTTLAANVVSTDPWTEANVTAYQNAFKAVYEAKGEIAFSRYFTTDFTANIVYSQYTDLFFWLLLITVVLTFFIFLIPLYCVHREMEIQSAPIQAHLDRIFKKISDLSKKLLNAGNSDIETMKGEIALLQDIYDKNSPVPVWPFNRSVAIKFLVSQSIALLTLAGGIVQQLLTAFAPLTNVIVPV